MSKVTYTSPSQTFTYSSLYGYFVQNDAWGAGNLTNGVNYWISSTFDPDDPQGGVSFSWMFPQDAGGVFAYPHIDFEAWGANVSSTQAANIVNLSANYDVNLSDPADSTVAFDLWFNTQPNGSWTTTSTELLIEVAPTSAGSPNEPFTLSGSGFTGATVYVSNSSAAGASWEFIDVKLSADMMSGTLSISDIIKELILAGVMTGQEYLTSLQFGSEVHGGTGSLQINSLGYNWTANATLVGTAGNDTFSIATPGGNDVVGNGGIDTVVYAGSYSDYQIKTAGSEILVTDHNNVSTLDELQGITFIQFSDGVYDVQTGSFAANAPALAAPAIGSFSPDTSIVGDGITNANQVTLTGTAVAGSTVEVFDGSTEIGTTTVSASGTWSFATGTLTDGTHAFTAEAVDAAGDVSAASAALNVTIDTVTPTAPTVVSFSPDSGTVGDGITNVNHITLTGTAVAGSTVEVFDGTTQIGTATTNANGAWSFATGTLADGTHAFTAEDVDVAGNVSAASVALNVTVDTAAPAAPVLLSDTNVTPNTLLITGTAQAGTTVRLYEGSTLLGTVVVDSSGNWSITTGPLSNGAHDFTATATDAAGNVSPISDVLDPVINAVPSPVVVSFSPDSNVVGDGITNVNHVTLTGTAAANSKVQIFDGSTLIATVTANASGNWSFATKTLTNGTHSFTAKDVNAAGNVSAASAALNVTIDTTAPGKPTISGFSPDTNVVGDGITDANHVSLTGTAEANSTVEIFDGKTEIGTAIANANGTWSFATGTLADGAHTFTTKAMDAAGNVGAASTALKVTVDTVAPAAPHVVSDTVSGNSLTVKGTAEANSLVDVYDGTTLLGTTHASKTGAWSFTTGALPLGLHELSATSTDVAGNVSSMSSILDATINPTDIKTGAKLELTGASSQSVKFDGATGTLILDHSMTFTGQIFNLTGNGSLSKSDQIDLKDISFGSGTVESYTGNSSGGTLTITDAQHHTASLSLVGDYTHSTFSLSSDGHGGTIVIDPPADNFNFVSGNPPAGTPTVLLTTLGRVENDGFVFHQSAVANHGGPESFPHSGFGSVIENNSPHAPGAPVHLDWAGGVQDADFVHPNDAAIHFAGLHAGNFMIH